MNAPFPITPAINNWLAQGERGVSSEAIVRHITGINVGSRRWFPDNPSDPDDLRRCILLLEAVPELRMGFDKLRAASPVWEKLVDNWDELVALFYEEVPNRNGYAPRTYKRMKELGC